MSVSTPAGIFEPQNREGLSWRTACSRKTGKYARTFTSSLVEPAAWEPSRDVAEEREESMVKSRGERNLKVEFVLIDDVN